MTPTRKPEGMSDSMTVSDLSATSRQHFCHLFCSTMSSRGSAHL